MSYILDALKKSEAERSRGSVPNLLIPPQTQFRSGVAVWVLLGALVVNAGLLAAWLFWPTISTSPTAKDSPPVAAPEATVPAPSPDRPIASREVRTRPPSQPVERELPSESESTVAAAEPVSPAAEPPQSQASRDDSDVQSFSFSTHVYASDPTMRAVTMNGKRFVEGDTISPGVRIKEITETGVVLDVNGRTVPVDVLQEWR